MATNDPYNSSTLNVPAATTTVPQPMSLLDKIKAWVSPSSTAGLLRDQNNRIDQAVDAQLK